MPPRHSAPGARSPWADLEADVTVLVKTFERPDALRRLLASIRSFYPRMPIVVVDDSAEPLEPVPESITRYVHAPYNSLGAAAGRNLGLTHVETPYVLVSDDDMVFERRTDVGRMLFRLETTSFDVVSCVWLDYDPWRGICRGVRRFEGTLDIEDGVLVHRLGATRGELDGLPVYDVVHQFFVASVDRLGAAPWDAELNLSEHYELFLSLKERGLRCTRLPGRRRPASPGAPAYVSGHPRGHRALRLALAREARPARAPRGRRAVPGDGQRPLPAARHRRVHRAPRLARRHAAAPGRAPAGLTRRFCTEAARTGVRRRS